MEDFIYLIALVAWAAFAFYRRSQKKAEQARQSSGRTGTGTPSRTLPTLEEILMGEEPAFEPEVAPSPEPTTYREPVMPKYAETTFEKEYNRRGITSIEELDKPLKIERLEEEEIRIEELDSTVEGFDPRRVRQNIREAVIYTEILNRPYV